MTCARPRLRAATLLVACASAAGCTGITSRPGAYTVRRDSVALPGARLDLEIVEPASSAPPQFLVVFASGDGGLRGVSKALLQHLADGGHAVVAFSSPDAFRGLSRQPGGAPNYPAARATFESIVAQGKRALRVREATPIVLAGVSRGASVVVAMAGDEALRPGVIGAVAVALTREFDELTVSEEAKQRHGLTIDEEGRLHTYPAIARLGPLPIAVIQSTHDGYVKAAESRVLLGPDTPTRRLYEVASRNHSFSGGRDALLRDLDAAMAWILERPR